MIVGGGLAGASAIEGIRDHDTSGPILLVGAEKHLPYDRPPLTKKLWFGKKKVEDIFLHDQAFYDQSGVTLALGRRVVAIDVRRKTVLDDAGTTTGYGRLLLATGGEPNRLTIPGGDLDGISYFRTLDDYLKLRSEATEGRSALVIGGGFIGSEIAAALNSGGVNVTMLFPGPYLVHRVFPEPLGRAIQARYAEHGVRVLAGDSPVAVAAEHGRFITRTQQGQTIESDMVIAGIGISPETALARQAGLAVGNGLIVNACLQTSDPDIYAAGDNAWWHSPLLGQSLRLEHWDNALSQGKWAGRNMAGAAEAFTYLPYFFSDLFEFGYEAVGEVGADLETYGDWQKENDTGVLYFLDGGKVVGAMMCNVWNKVDAAREMIRLGTAARPKTLKGAIH